MKKILVLSLICLLACNINGAKNVQIQGKLINSNKQQIYLYMLTAQGFSELDSTTINADGSFAFKAKLTQKTFYKIGLTEQNFLLLIADENENIFIESDAKQLADVIKIKGSNDAVLLNELQQLAKRNYVKIDSLQKAFQQQAQANPAGAQALQQQVMPIYNQLVEEQTRISKNFIDKNTNSFASLSAIEMLNPENDVEYFNKVDKALLGKFPKSQYLIAFHQRVLDMQKLNVGSKAPDLVLNTPEDKPFALSNLKGKVVLLDFWASWCRPCRAENPNVVKMYNKLHSKGLEILGVSLDATKKAWTDAIAKDGLMWYHISDLQQWSSAAAKAYNVTTIPMTYLIDKEGKIAGKNLRGPQLEAKIEELLAK